MPRTASSPLIGAFAAGDLAVRGDGSHSMLARHGFPSCLPDARPSAQLAGAVRSCSPGPSSAIGSPRRWRGSGLIDERSNRFHGPGSRWSFTDGKVPQTRHLGGVGEDDRLVRNLVAAHVGLPGVTDFGSGRWRSEQLELDVVQVAEDENGSVGLVADR